MRKNQKPAVPDGVPSHLTTCRLPQIGDKVMLINGYNVVLVYNGPDGLDDGYGEFVYEDKALNKIVRETLAYECVCPEEERLKAILEELEGESPEVPEHERVDTETDEDGN